MTDEEWCRLYMADMAPAWCLLDVLMKSGNRPEGRMNPGDTVKIRKPEKFVMTAMASESPKSGSLPTHEVGCQVYHFETRHDQRARAGEIQVYRYDGGEFDPGELVYTHTLTFTPVEHETPEQTFRRHAERVRREFIAGLE